MPATAATIWAVPAYLPSLQPPLTIEAIAQAEAKIGYQLPVAYLALLRTQNGGYIRYELADIAHRMIAGIGPNFPSLTSFDWEDEQEHVSFKLQGLVPFDGDGHWHLCLDYRQNAAQPTITYVDLESDAESRVSDSFCHYLAQLRVTLDAEYVLEGITDIERLKVVLSRSLNAVFDPTDVSTHGYPIERARIGNQREPMWLWLSPNTVPRGFVRPDDRRFQALNHLMAGHSDRYPGLPHGCYLVSVTDHSRSVVLNAFRNAGFPLKPIYEYDIAL